MKNFSGLKDGVENDSNADVEDTEDEDEAPKKENKKPAKKAAKANAEDSKLDIPSGMIELEIDNMLKDFEQRLAYQGLNLEQYLKMLGKPVSCVEGTRPAGSPVSRHHQMQKSGPGR